MGYFHAKPGVATAEMFLKLKDKNNVGAYTTQVLLTVPAIIDITQNRSQGIFSWSTLDSTGQFKVPTTSDNSISGNLVMDPDTFYGDGTTDGPKDIGVHGLSDAAILVEFEIYTGDKDDSTDGKYISGEGFITGLAPTLSADGPIWQSSFTITVSGEYTVSDTALIT